MQNRLPEFPWTHWQYTTQHTDNIHFWRTGYSGMTLTIWRLTKLNTLTAQKLDWLSLSIVGKRQKKEGKKVKKRRKEENFMETCDNPWGTVCWCWYFQFAHRCKATCMLDLITKIHHSVFWTIIALNSILEYIWNTLTIYIALICNLTHMLKFNIVNVL